MLVCSQGDGTGGRLFKRCPTLSNAAEILKQVLPHYHCHAVESMQQAQKGGTPSGSTCKRRSFICSSAPMCMPGSHCSTQPSPAFCSTH
eukprot:scaffold17035_cov21-Tisochrysis_lutea.AAC.2